MAKKRTPAPDDRPAPLPVVWLRSEVKSPPLSTEARIEAGRLIRRVQRGDPIEMPHRRPMPDVGAGCAELRIDDGPERKSWRLVYRRDADAVVIMHVFEKKTQKTPLHVIRLCRERLRDYDSDS